jgi:hypothetical protein
MKINSKHNQRRRIAVASIVLALLVANFQPVQAMFVDMHILVSLWRFEREVLQASFAGQYFDGLAWIHIFEGIRILRDHPEHMDEIHSLADLTLSHLDSLLDGKGDTAIITEQQVKAVEAEVNWWMSVASPSLQSDIQSTLELYPLDQFVGMTMNEAVEYANSRFNETREEPNIVNGTNGQWASYIYKGVYFEYPSSWYVKVKEDSYGNGNLFIIPSSESNEQWNTGVTTFEAWEILPDPIRPFDLHREIDYVNAKWEKAVIVDGMEGYFFIYDPSQTGMFRKLESILYDQDKKIKVRVTVTLFNFDEVFFDLDVNEARKKYEYLFHITESVRLH